MTDIPKEPQELRQALWEHLRERLRIRKEFGAGLGRGPDQRTASWQRSPRGISSGVSTPGTDDVQVSGAGTILLGEMLGIFPDDLPHQEIQPALPRLLDEAFELVRSGILRPDPSTTYGLTITPHGAACLDADDRDLPPFSQERVQQLRDRFAGAPDLDLLARHYGESIAAYHAGGLDLSSTVMIGACYELGLHQVAQAFVRYEDRTRSKVPGTNGKDRNAVEAIRKGKPVMAGPVENLVHDVLVNGFGADLGADLEWAKTCLRPNGHFVRNLRNAAGHPTGRAVDRDQIAAYIMLFPDFYGRVRSVVGTVGGRGDQISS